MKQTPQMKIVEENMRPGVITLLGFLGKDSRNLVDILIEDDGAVKRLGLTHELIAEKMNLLRDEGMRGLGEFVDAEPCFEVKVESVRGKMPCPFEHPGIFPKTNIYVRNKKTGREIFYTDMHIHLIRVHGFYEGKGFPFRLEPEELAEVLAEVLEIEPDLSAQPNGSL